MRDNLADPGTDVDSGTAGYQTKVPIVKWDTVPGASAYLIDVAPNNAGVCDWGTRLARVDGDPVVDAARQRLEQHQAVPGCDARFLRRHAPPAQPALLRPRARPGRARHAATRTSTATSRTSTTGPARRSSGSAIRPAAPARRRCNPGYLGADDYVLPARGTLTRLTPLITWKPIAGHQSYFVIVCEGRELLATSSDYAFTQVPGLLAAQPDQADDVLGRDDALLLGRPARDGPQRERRGRRPTVGSRLELPEAVDAADADEP